MNHTRKMKSLGTAVLVFGLIIGSVSIYGIQADDLKDDKNDHEIVTIDESNAEIIIDENNEQLNTSNEEIAPTTDIENADIITGDVDTLDNVIPNTYVIKDIFPDAYLADVMAMELGKNGPEDTVDQFELDSITQFIYDGSVEDPFRPAMKSIDGLEYLRNLDSITIVYSDITNVDALSSLDNIAYLDLVGNRNLENVEGLYGLNSAGHVNISNNKSLTSTEGLRNLHNVQGSIIIHDNENLETLGLVNLQVVENDFSIVNNTNLKSIDGLGSLELVMGSIIIENNDSITTFTSAQRLETGGFVVVSIMNNKNLETIAFNDQYLTSLPLVEIKDNTALRSVTGLAGLQHISGLTISNTNVNLVEIDAISKNPSHTLQFNNLDLRNNAILDLSQFSRVDGSRTMDVDATGQRDTLVVPYVNGKFVLENPLKDIDGNPIVPTVKNGSYDASTNMITFNHTSSKKDYGFDWSYSTGNTALYENYKFSGKVTVLLEDTTLINSKDMTLMTTDTWHEGDAFLNATVIANNTLTEYPTYKAFVAAGGTVTTTVPSPLVAGAYTVDYSLNGVTSRSTITVIDAPVITDTYTINGSDFTVSLKDAKAMTSQDIITRSNAKGMNTTQNTPVAVDTTSSSFNSVGVYPVTLFVSEHVSTTTTINVTVVNDEVIDKTDDKGKKETPNDKTSNTKNTNKGNLPKTGMTTSNKAIVVGSLLVIAGGLLIAKKKFND